jgi:hypothetical protein
MDINREEDNMEAETGSKGPGLVLKVEVRWCGLKFAVLWLNNAVAMVMSLPAKG